jgi:hypothetical protein
MNAALESLVREIVLNEFLTNWRYWAIQALIVFVAASIGNFATSYFRKRGENLATRQDIEEITRKIEQVKEEIQARHTLRFAALEKRLQAHQEAFGHCRRLLESLQSDADWRQKLNAMQNWFNDNGLYLEVDATKAFWDSYYAAIEYDLHRSSSPRNTKGMKENYAIVRAAPNAMREAVGLPSLNLRADETIPS